MPTPIKRKKSRIHFLWGPTWQAIMCIWTHICMHFGPYSSKEAWQSKCLWWVSSHTIPHLFFLLMWHASRIPIHGPLLFAWFDVSIWAKWSEEDKPKPLWRALDVPNLSCLSVNIQPGAAKGSLAPGKLSGTWNCGHIQSPFCLWPPLLCWLNFLQ